MRWLLYAMITLLYVILIIGMELFQSMFGQSMKQGFMDIAVLVLGILIVMKYNLHSILIFAIIGYDVAESFSYFYSGTTIDLQFLYALDVKIGLESQEYRWMVFQGFAAFAAVSLICFLIFLFHFFLLKYGTRKSNTTNILNFLINRC